MGSYDFLEYVFDHTETGIAIVGIDGAIMRANRAGAALIGRTPELVASEPFIDFVHPDDIDDAMAELGRTVVDGHGGPADMRIRQPDGSYTWIRARATLVPGDEPTIYVNFDVVDAEKLAQMGLQAAQQQQAAVAELGRAALGRLSVRELAQRACELVATTLAAPCSAVLLDDGEPEGLLMVAVTGRLTDLAGTYQHRRSTGLASVLGHAAPTMVEDVRLEPAFQPADRLAAAGILSLASAPIDPRSTAPGLLVAGADGVAAFTADDLAFLASMANVVASAIDASNAMEDLRHHALHDPLTGLPNRVLVLDRLGLALEQAAGNGTQVAVLVCDIDRFKVVNDGMGHAAGDDLLREIALRLRGAVRPGDTVGRFGGDEFVIVCPDVASLDAVVAIADRLADAAREPAEVDGTELVTTVSIGIALGAAVGEDAAAGLLRDADAAMYRAKERGRSRYELFDDDMRSTASQRLRTETELRRALENGVLVLHYQPVLTADVDEVVGLESLVRWPHPVRGLLEPAAFVELAGESGLVPELGAWAFRTAALQSVAWAAESWWGDRWIAVNLAPRQLSDHRLLERIDDALEQTGADPAHLRVELTEDALIEDDAQSVELLRGLTQRGIRISVDDFGTGYSSLAYLKRLPLDALKLDRSFVAGLAEDGEDRVITGAILAMAHALGLQVIAEGVEEPRQLAVLQQLGCDLVQGYLLARPQPAAEVARWLAERA